MLYSRSLFLVISGRSFFFADGVAHAADRLDEVYTFNFANGATYKTSVMSFVKGLLESHSTEENYVNICSAMYWYNQSANKVFE